MKCDICGREDFECKIKCVKGKFYCPKHLTQYYRYGKFLDETIYDKNEIIIEPDCAKIILKDKYLNVVDIAEIDVEDIGKCEQYKWHVKHGRRTDYAITTINEHEKMFLHRLVLNYYRTDDVDHKDRNGLNNRKNNLKVCSHSENLINQPEDRNGIFKVKSGHYRASITKNYKSIYIGTYNTFNEALFARNNAKKRLFT